LVLQAGIDLYGLLYRAVEHGSIEMVKTILDSGLEINIEEIYHGPSGLKSPLTCASMGGHAAIAQILLDHGAKTDDPARTEFLFIRGHIDVVRILVAREHDIDRRYGQFGATLLHLVAFNHDELIEELIQRGFKVNARDCNNMTPLSYALGTIANAYGWFYGYGKVNEDAVRPLLAAGAEISTMDPDFIRASEKLKKFID
jgi:ankyrin repeat protein